MNNSYLGFLLISLPEAFLIGILSILSVGKFSFFSENKKNIIRILIYAIISAALSLYFHNRVSGEESLLVYILITPLLFIFLLKLKLYESIIASIFGLALQVITEVLWLSFAQPFIASNIDFIYSNTILLFLLSLPTRMLQLALIILSYKFRIKIIDFERKDVKKKEYYIQIIVYVLSVSTLVFLAFLLTKMVIFGDPNEVLSIDGSLIRINIYLILFVIIILTLAVKNTTDYYKNKNKLNTNEFLQNITYISNLINEENITEAKDAIERLKTHLIINKNY
ncbi:hypothetical protein Clocl_0025 [Acetivibrio clariflavus DSM 19732]|uniref:Uncharacterized protein n=2 Tax=Acetivibrio clariflavus TaxID=288965 RepID=G8LYR5_ACECE|nr:hypothetical protein Clocl_0025 [Acetivibrio clariflavus DSM 19732]